MRTLVSRNGQAVGKAGSYYLSLMKQDWLAVWSQINYSNKNKTKQTQKTNKKSPHTFLEGKGVWKVVS